MKTTLGSAATATRLTPSLFCSLGHLVRAGTEGSPCSFQAHLTGMEVFLQEMTWVEQLLLLNVAPTTPHPHAFY